jgi:transposase
MSGATIAPYFPFRRIKIIKQSVLADASESRVWAKPSKRHRPVCHGCGQKACGVHSWAERSVRDLNMASARVWIRCRYRKLFCPRCQGVRIEDLQLFHPYLRVTRRMARYVYQLCHMMTVSQVARHLGLNWKTVKDIDKHYLERDYGQPDLNGLRILAVDEISMRKGHRYLTVVLDYLSGRVVFVGKDRKADTLMQFFNQLTDNQRDGIEAVVMDMWDPFIKAVKKKYLKPKLYSICFTWSPILTALSIRSEIPNTIRPTNRIKPSIKAASICCSKTRRILKTKASANNSRNCWRSMRPSTP